MHSKWDPILFIVDTTFETKVHRALVKSSALYVEEGYLGGILCVFAVIDLGRSSLELSTGTSHFLGFEFLHVFIDFSSKVLWRSSTYI